MKASHYEYGLGHISLVGNTLSIDLTDHKLSDKKVVWKDQYINRDKAVLLSLVEKYFDYWTHHNYNNKEHHADHSL